MAGLPIWNDAGRFGLEEGAFLPPLALTLHEAMAFFLAARLLTKATDELDTELIGAFVKLAQVLPPVLAEQLQATADGVGRHAPRRDVHARPARPDRGARPAARRRHRVRRRRLRPSQGHAAAAPAPLRDRAIGADARALPHRQRRGAWRAADVQGRAHPLGGGDAGSLRPWPAAVAAQMRAAWDVVGDDEPVRIVIRFDASVAQRVAETRWHPSQVLEPAADGSLLWTGRVSGVLESAPGSSAGARTPRSSSRPSCAPGSPLSRGPRRTATADPVPARPGRTWRHPASVGTCARALLIGCPRAWESRLSGARWICRQRLYRRRVGASCPDRGSWTVLPCAG